MATRARALGYPLLKAGLLVADTSPNIATLASVINKGVENRLKDLHTAMPGIIETFDPVTQTASVQPAIMRIFSTDDGEKVITTPAALPLLINVPVQYPRGGGFSLTFPVSPGDECLLVFSERALDSWHQFGGVQRPSQRRFHHLSDATAFVGLSSAPRKIGSYNANSVELRNDAGDQFIQLQPGKNINVVTPADINATCANTTVTASGSITANCASATVNASGSVTVNSPVSTFNGNVVITGSLSYGAGLTGAGGGTISGELAVNGIPSSTHTHPQGPDSNGDTQQNTGGPLP